MIRRWLALVILAILLEPSLVFAFYMNPVNSQPGFTHPTPLQHDDTLAGKILDGSRIIRGLPVVGDLDGNPNNGLEIVIGDRNGKLFALRNNGTVIWTTQVATCRLTNDDDSLLNGAPSLFDLDPTRPGLEVIVGYGTITYQENCPGGIRAYSSNGEPLWDYRIPINPISNLSGVFSTPSVTDVDGRGDIIIVAGSADLYLHVLNKDGSLRWKYHAMDTIWSSPAFADVNGDGRKDIIVGTDFSPGMVCDPNSISPFPETNSYYESAKGFLYAFPADPTFVTDPYCAKDGGKVIGFGKGFLWAVRFDQTIYSSPAIADLDDDDQLEVIVGSGCFYGGNPRPGKWVKIFNAANGVEKMTLNAPECIASAPAIGDITGDGRLEIVAAVASGGSVDPQVNIPQEGGQLVAWRHNDPNPIWKIVVRGATQEQADMSEPFNNPLIADIDGNGSHEVIIVVQNSVMIYNGKGQELTPSCPTSGLEAQSCRDNGKKSMFMWMPIRSTPAIADIDNDGKLEIVVGGSHTSYNNSETQQKAVIYVWRDIEKAISSDTGPYRSYSAPWPQFQRDPAHNGLLLARKLRVSTRAIYFLTDGSQPHPYQFTLSSNDGTPINVTIRKDDPHNILQLSSNTVSLSSASSSLIVTVNTTGKTNGEYTAQIILNGDDVPEVRVPVTLRIVNEVFTTFVPLALR